MASVGGDWPYLLKRDSNGVFWQTTKNIYLGNTVMTKAETPTINNGADITVPTTGGTLALTNTVNAKDLIVNSPATTPTGDELTAYRNLGEKLVVANPGLTSATMDAILCSPNNASGIGWTSGAEALAFMNGLSKAGGTITGSLTVNGGIYI